MTDNTVTRAELEQLRKAWMETQVRWMQEGGLRGDPPSYAQDAWQAYTAAQRAYRHPVGS